MRRELGTDFTDLVENVLRPAGKARLAVSYTLCLLPSVYSWLYWFSFGKPLPWLPSTPLLLIHPGKVQVYTALQPWLWSLMWVNALPWCLWMSMGQKLEDCVDCMLVAPSCPALGKEQGTFHLMSSAVLTVFEVLCYILLRGRSRKRGARSLPLFLSFTVF